MNKKQRESLILQEGDFTVDAKSRVLAIFFNRVVSFNFFFKRSLIMLRRSKLKVDKAIDLSAYVFGIAGLLCFIFWIYLNINFIILRPETLLFFYKSSNALILLFLISLIFDMFIIYRVSEKKARMQRIKTLRPLKKLDGVLDYKKLPKLDISGSLNDEMTIILENSYLLASKLKQKEVGTIHLFWSLLHSPRISNLLVRLNVDINSLVALLKKYLLDQNKIRANGQRTVLSVHVQEILLSAFSDAYSNNQESVSVLNVVLFCYQKNTILQEILYELEISQNKIENAVKWFSINDKMRHDYKIFRKMARLKPSGNMNRSYTAIATPTIDYFSRDMTTMAKYGYFEACVAREKEIKQIFEAFEGGQSGVLLVGHPGVGKKTIIEGLAQLMVKEEVPDFLEDKRLVELDVSRLISGASPVQAQERLLSIINEMQKSKNIILFIENIENIMGIASGSEESLELSEVLAETLSRRGIYCLASVSSENYSRYIEGKALASSMAPIKVLEPSKDDAIYMVESKIAWIENKYGVYFDYSSIEETVDMSAKYINDKFLPEKAVDVIKAAAVKMSKLSQKDPHKKVCTKNDIAEVISDITGILVSKVTESEGEKLMNLEQKIHDRMIGQEEAVTAVAGSLRRARAELREGTRPIASFLFLGPTGVGKTELAKTVSDIYFGDERYMIRLDMSEYQLADSVRKMIGDVGGTLGYLTEAVRKKPFSLILFDEIEKAHPDILNLFLQILDDGRLTDGQGRTINFTNSIIIATSNAGALFIQQAVKENMEMEIIKQELIDVHLNKIMRPELINRFDGIIVFKPLTLDNILAIAKLMIKKIEKNLVAKGMNLLFEEDGLLKLAKAGYDPKFGARPLRRLLQDKIENEIANLILARKISRRDTIIINKEGNLDVEKAKSL
jgi:ATP-dependent Clp protease ATP-binding subunit ClpC